MSKNRRSATTKSKKIAFEKYNQEIDEAVASIKNGKYLSHEQVEALTEGRETILTKEQKAELDKNLAEYKVGKLKYYTLNTAKRIVHKSIR